MNVLIIEDEKKTAKMLCDIIETNDVRLVVNVLDSIEESVKYLLKNQSKIDLIFMDIHLADGLSFEIFKQVKINTPIIFCSAYDDYMFKAFKSNGFDYILKPFKVEDIELAFTKLEQLKVKFENIIITPESITNNSSVNELLVQTSFLVHYREKILALLVSDIAFLVVEDEVISVFNLKGEKYKFSKTLEQFENAVSSKDFFRINRKMIVNRKVIKEIEPYFNRKALVHLTIPYTEIPIVSRLKVVPFLKWIEIPH